MTTFDVGLQVGAGWAGTLDSYQVAMQDDDGEIVDVVALISRGEPIPAYVEALVRRAAADSGVGGEVFEDDAFWLGFVDGVKRHKASIAAEHGMGRN